MGWRSIRFGLAANLLAILAPLSLLFHPTGSRVHPIGQQICIFFAGFIGLLGCLMALGAMMDDEENHQPWRVGLLLGIMPFPLAAVVLHKISEFHLLELVP